MSWMPEGAVYGVLLNFCAEVEALAPQMHQPPYKASREAMKLTPWGVCLLAGDAFDADYGPLGRFEFHFN